MKKTIKTHCACCGIVIYVNEEDFATEDNFYNVFYCSEGCYDEMEGV